MNWREMVSDKLMTPAEAVQAVISGDVVAIAAINCTPFTLCQALYDRREELSGVRIDHPAPLFSRGCSPGTKEPSRCTTSTQPRPTGRWLMPAEWSIAR